MRLQQRRGPVKRACVLILALMMVVSGCGDLRVVDPDRPGEILLDLNAAAENKPVRVELLSGRTLSGTRIHAASDSTVWFDSGDRRVAVSTARIAKVDIVGRRRGRPGRLGRGALIGAAPGGIALASLLVSGEHSDSGLEGVFVAVLIIGGALLGAAVGFVFGEEEETTTTYIINEHSAGIYLE